MADRTYHESPRGRRARLATVLRQAGQIVSVQDAATALNTDKKTAAKLLARWHSQRWLQRVGHGLYTVIPIDARATEQVLEDPLVLVPALFGRAYVGGWSAAEHWDLTEQLFRDTLVFTTKSIRSRKHDVHGITFMLRHINGEAFFGTRTIWRGQTKVQISDIHRTMVDMLADPATGGGSRHVADCFQEYIRHKDANPHILIEYAERLGNGAVFKRMGFLAETMSDQKELVEASRARLTQGNAKLDPAVKSPRLVRAWRLWIPETWSRKNQVEKGGGYD
jgi:predicted transcriptional regulator of viral defense system